MKAFLILEDGHVFTGTSIGSRKEIISEIVFNTSMTGYLEVLTDPSYAGQAVCMTYPLIGYYGICYEDQESLRPWPDGYIVRELSRMPSNFRCEDSIQNFLKRYDIPGIAGIDTRALTKELGTLMRRGDERFEKFDLSLYPAELDPVKHVVPRETMALVYTACKRFAENFSPASPNLLLQGGTGLGKTYLSACIARVVADKGCSVCYESASAALDCFERAKFSRDTEEGEAAAELLINVIE